MNQLVVVCILKYLSFFSFFLHWNSFQELLEVLQSLDYGYTEEQLI